MELKCLMELFIITIQYKYSSQKITLQFRLNESVWTSFMAIFEADQNEWSSVF